MKRTLGILLAAAPFFALVSAADAGMVYVAINGTDSVSCGAKTAPCGTITQGIHNAGVGDTVIVGPGGYRGETGTPSCGCFVAVDKPVHLVSSDGAPSTVIDARGSAMNTNVLVSADGSEFGRPGKGFTVTNAMPNCLTIGAGIAIDAKHVKIRGNQVIGDTFCAGIGIAAVAGNPGPMLIEGNQVMLWDTGIQARGPGNTVTKNQLLLTGAAITP
jgi:hypothetical protein